MTDTLLTFAIVGLAMYAINLAYKQGAADERMRANAENLARLQRQNEVENKPVSKDDLRKSLDDGTF